jgi:DNA-binding NarL/FixJ family response regulator
VTDTPETLRVVVADDHAFYRAGLARILRETGIDVVAEVPDGETAIRAVDDLAPDVVVMDLHMPGLSGIEATRRLTEHAPATRVLVLSISVQEADVTDAILAGACGYVLKDGPMEEIVAGIQAAANGASLISPRIATTLLRRLRNDAGVTSDAVTSVDPGLADAALTTRELDVLALLAEGRPNSEIAALLTLSPLTIRNHISSILTKLQVENRVQAAVRAVREQMV